MFAGVNTPQGVTMNGALESSSICDWTCGSSSSSARCEITGNMNSNHFNFLNAGNNVLNVVSKKFQSNKVGFAKGASVRFDSNGGSPILFNSIDSLFSTQSNGELLVASNTIFERNRFIVLSFDKVNIKGTLNRNDATIAEVRKSCSGPAVLMDKIRVKNLKLPARSTCLRIFKQD